ncbi:MULTISPECIES: CGNR zinc finger domain-containing protein [Streptomyces]|uniref:CGNR zinc finger domain-containing protein n=1 Tax=Streptomyces luteosporeus TaxID=173856 RepID=A0ABN3TPE8_9ACTN
MIVNHDTRRTLDCVVDLLNTDLGADPGPGRDGPAVLREFVARHGIVGIDAFGEAELAAVRAVQERFARAFDAPDDAAVAEQLNALVAGAGTTPRLTDHDGHPWHVHYFAPGASLAEHLAADGGMALAFLLVEGERERLRRCVAPGCGRAFVDFSRNRSRRYCDGRTCGNRLHVAAYRARRREAGRD